MLADLIFVFLCAIVVGSILMFIRLWRERQLIRGEYTQIPTFDTYDLETGQRKGEYNNNNNNNNNRSNNYSYGSNNNRNNNGRRNGKSKKMKVKKTTNKSARSPKRTEPGHLSPFGSNNVQISSSKMSKAAIRAATFCRNSSFYKWIDVLLPLWSRREEGKKHFFLIEYCPDAATEYRQNKEASVNGFERKNSRIFRVIMSLIEIQGFAASKLLEKHSKETLDTLIVRLTSIRHPYLLPIWEIDVVSNRTTENPVLAFGNPFVPSGSLRDLIYRVQDPLVQKKSMYGRGGRPVKFKKLRVWGRQILEGLIALKQHGFSYIPLHTGNVMVLSDSAGSYRVVITGWETAVFGCGLSNKRSRLVKKTVSLNTTEHLAVIFGYLFFEMAFGIEMIEYKPNYTGLSASRRRWNSPIRRILDLIFEGGWITPEEEPFSDDDGNNNDEEDDDDSDKEEDDGNEENGDHNSNESNKQKDDDDNDINENDNNEKQCKISEDIEDVEEVFHDNSKKKKRKTNNKKGSSNNNNSTRARYHDGIVTLEEIAELSFFQFTEDENVDIKSNPIQLPEDILDEDDVDDWKQLLKKCCHDASLEGKEMHKIQAKKEAISLKPRSPNRKKGRYNRSRKGGSTYQSLRSDFLNNNTTTNTDATNAVNNGNTNNSSNNGNNINNNSNAKTAEEKPVVEKHEVEETKEQGIKNQLGPEYDKFRSMLKVGVPEGAVRAKCLQAGLNPDALFNTNANNNNNTASPPVAKSIPSPPRPRVNTTIGNNSGGTTTTNTPSTSVPRMQRAMSMPTPPSSNGRLGMLAGIKSFSKGALKKTKTVDKTKLKKDEDKDNGSSSGGGGSFADMLKKQFAARGMK